jgi:hypothetical protein
MIFFRIAAFIFLNATARALSFHLQGLGNGASHLLLCHMPFPRDLERGSSIAFPPGLPERYSAHLQRPTKYRIFL